MAEGTATRARPLARDDVDWSRLYREGFRLELGAPPSPLAEASVFLAPLSERDDLVVILAPVPRTATGGIRVSLERAAGLARQARGLWTWLQSLAPGRTT